MSWDWRYWTADAKSSIQIYEIFKKNGSKLQRVKRQTPKKLSNF